MIFQKFEDIDLNNFPVIIFGSGPAGITTALELENKKISSIIIEAGNEEYNEDSQDFYRGRIIGDQLVDLSQSRLRQLGGTSGHWGGWCKPMESYNLDNWPIKKEDLDKAILSQQAVASHRRWVATLISTSAVGCWRYLLFAT